MEWYWWVLIGVGVWLWVSFCAFLTHYWIERDFKVGDVKETFWGFVIVLLYRPISDFMCWEYTLFSLRRFLPLWLYAILLFLSLVSGLMFLRSIIVLVLYIIVFFITLPYALMCEKANM